MNSVLFAVVAALAVHSGLGCKLIIDSIYEVSDLFSAKIDYNTRVWSTTFNKPVQDYKFHVYFEENGDEVGDLEGVLCNFENNDDEGIVAQLITKSLGIEGFCEVSGDTWNADEKSEISDDYCNALLTKVKGEQVFLNIDLYKGSENIGAMNLVVRSDKWNPRERG